MGQNEFTECYRCGNDEAISYNECDICKELFCERCIYWECGELFCIECIDDHNCEEKG